MSEVQVTEETESRTGARVKVAWSSTHETPNNLFKDLCEVMNEEPDGPRLPPMRRLCALANDMWWWRALPTGWAVRMEPSGYCTRVRLIGEGGATVFVGVGDTPDLAIDALADGLKLKWLAEDPGKRGALDWKTAWAVSEQLAKEREEAEAAARASGSLSPDAP